MKNWTAISFDGLGHVSGGLGVPRPPETNPEPRRPENWDFWGPHLDRDPSYRPERDAPANPEPPVFRYEPEQAPTWTQPPRGEERAALSSGSSDESYDGGDASMTMASYGGGLSGDDVPSPTYPDEPVGEGGETTEA